MLSASIKFGFYCNIAGLIICCPLQAEGPLMTRWAAGLSAANVHREYPRPQMVRKDWMNLNGLWEYAIKGKDEGRPAGFDGQILVPFPVESALSGVMKAVGAEKRLWYRRTFEAAGKSGDKRTLLHFGAVDWDATVWINGKEVGSHKGGYDPFTFDITEALKDKGQQEIVVSVWDPTDAGYQPRGKQVSKPGGIFYTAVTGIWQSVWLEQVNDAYIKSLVIVPDIDNKSVCVTAICSKAAKDCDIEVVAKDRFFVKARAKGKAGRQLILVIDSPKLWSPDSPFLYDVKIKLKNKKGKTVDEAGSYFAMRKISLGKGADGITRILLNNKFLFEYGPLDQGWWPDGLYTAPTDEALRYDVEVMKKLGFNMVRKHVKVEPDRWYYWCDKMGLLVWQDMPSGDKYISPQDPDFKRSEESAKQFEGELQRIMEALGNHPCITTWVAFNEGWGQYDTERITKWIKDYDPVRLVINASGWADRGVGDIHDIHNYPDPAMPSTEANRAIVLGEFGGLGLPVKGHTWQDEKSWGYRKFDTNEKLTAAYLELLEKLKPLIAKGLSAAVYTQTTDVETEVNGLMTYDRAVIKMNREDIAKANKKLQQ